MESYDQLTLCYQIQTFNTAILKAPFGHDPQ
jgi:hypothetical protein